MKVIDEYITGFKENSYIAELYSLGFKPKEVHQILYEKFEPYFSDKKNLHNYIIAPLPSIVESFISIIYSNEEKKLLDECLSLYQSALHANSKDCLETFNNWESEIYRGISHSRSILNLDRNRSLMNLEDFAKDLFEYVGNFIEVIINAYLRMVYQLRTIIKKNYKEFEEIRKLSLGNIVKNIINEGILKEVVSPSPWSIPLNQWRNIAQHYKYDIINEVIHCKYGESSKEVEFTLLKIELWSFVNKLFRIQGVLKVAHHIFILDNKHQYNQLVPKQRKNLREEAKILDIFSSISIQGYHFLDYKISPNRIRFVLMDLTSDKSRKRQMQLLNFLYPIWFNTRKKFLEIEYHDIDNIPVFEIKVDTEMNRNIFRKNLKIGELKQSDLLKVIVINKLK